MVRPLRKTKLDFTSYFRREAVEVEIEAVLDLSVPELERRAALWPSSASGFISPGALVYLVRNLPDSVHRDKLTGHLLGRVARRLPSVADAGSHSESLTRMNIREDVRDRFVDLVLSDRDVYDDRLDYYEVNFNHALAAARQDSSNRHWKHENRIDELGSSEVDISEWVETAV